MTDECGLLLGMCDVIVCVCVLERCEDRTETRMEKEDAKEEEEEDVLLVVSDLSDQVQGGWCCRQSGGVTSWVAAQGVMV